MAIKIKLTTIMAIRYINRKIVGLTRRTRVTTSSRKKNHLRVLCIVASLLWKIISVTS